MVRIVLDSMSNLFGHMARRFHFMVGVSSVRMSCMIKVGLRVVTLCERRRHWLSMAAHFRRFTAPLVRLRSFVHGLTLVSPLSVMMSHLHCFMAGLHNMDDLVMNGNINMSYWSLVLREGLEVSSFLKMGFCSMMNWSDVLLNMCSNMWGNVRSNDSVVLLFRMVICDSLMSCCLVVNWHSVMKRNLCLVMSRYHFVMNWSDMHWGNVVRYFMMDRNYMFRSLVVDWGLNDMGLLMLNFRCGVVDTGRTGRLNGMVNRHSMMDLSQVGRDRVNWLVVFSNGLVMHGDRFMMNWSFVMDRCFFYMTHGIFVLLVSHNFLVMNWGFVVDGSRFVRGGNLVSYRDFPMDLRLFMLHDFFVMDRFVRVHESNL